jgi:hypothetical protein
MIRPWGCCFLILFCFITTCTCGQISVGTKIGIALNQFSQPGTTIGVNSGVYASYRLTSFAVVTIEPHYAQEGGGRPSYFRQYGDVSANVSSIEFLNPSVCFHNIQIPVLFFLSLPEFEEASFKPVAIVGASYGFTLSAVEQHTKRYTFNSVDDPSQPTIVDKPLDISYQKENVTDNYARNQWSLWIGFGAQFKKGDRVFGFDLRFRKGLTQLNHLRFASPVDENGRGVPGTGGKLFSNSVTASFHMSLFNL